MNKIICVIIAIISIAFSDLQAQYGNYIVSFSNDLSGDIVRSEVATMVLEVKSNIKERVKVGVLSLLYINMPKNSITSNAIEKISIQSDHWKIDKVFQSSLKLYCIKEFELSKDSVLTLNLYNMSTVGFKDGENNIRFNLCTEDNNEIFDITDTVSVSDDNLPKIRETIDLFFPNNEGFIYVSDSSDVIKNDLLINIKNKGTEALYVIKGDKPRITIEFTEGKTINSISHDLYLISARADYIENNQWEVSNPEKTSSISPMWTLTPKLNAETIDGKTKILDSFETLPIRFSGISSYIAGSTSVTLTFYGFRKSDNTMYLNQEKMVLNIQKKNIKTEDRIISKIYPTKQYFNMDEDDNQIQVGCVWGLKYVSYVMVSVNNGLSKKWVYDNSASTVTRDSASILGVKNSGDYHLYMDAYDGHDNKIDCKQVVIRVIKQAQ